MSRNPRIRGHRDAPGIYVGWASVRNLLLVREGVWSGGEVDAPARHFRHLVASPDQMHALLNASLVAAALGRPDEYSLKVSRQRLTHERDCLRRRPFQNPPT